MRPKSLSRRKAPEEEEKLDRWLISYADFITLLFAFFVVMYALSSINDGKYRVLSDSMVQAFRNVQIVTTTPLAVVPALPLQRPQKAQPAEKTAKDAAREKSRAKMKNVAQDIMKVMASLVEQGKVRVMETDRGVTIEINDSVIFSSAQAVLHPELARAMKAVADVLAPTEYPITIEGHTDNIPIKTAQFPSNWELSAVRATTVLRLFMDSGVSPKQLVAIGYADTRPVVDNDTPEGRARNRRVNILIDSYIPDQDAHEINPFPES